MYLRGAGAEYIMIGVYVDGLTIAAQPLTATFPYSDNNSAIAPPSNLPGANAFYIRFI